MQWTGQEVRQMHQRHLWDALAAQGNQIQTRVERLPQHLLSAQHLCHVCQCHGSNLLCETTFVVNILSHVIPVKKQRQPPVYRQSYATRGGPMLTVPVSIRLNFV
jgi:hypothetical protein